MLGQLDSLKALVSSTQTRDSSLRARTPARTLSPLVALGLTVSLSLAACAEEVAPPVDNESPSPGKTSTKDPSSTDESSDEAASDDTSSDDTAAKPGSSSGTTGTGSKGSATKPSMDAGTVVSTDAGKGSTSAPIDPVQATDAGASSSPEAAVPDAGSSTPGLAAKCTTGSTDACGIFVTASGTEIPLGPYGAVMDKNAGKGFENSVNLLDTDAQCESFAIQGFGGSAEEAKEVSNSKGLDLKLYTVYRPATWVEGETYPIVSWGNGTCAKPEGYGALLRYVASHGYIVVAPNSRWVGSGAAQKRAIDFAVAANADSKSPYYKRVATDKVAAMGHSQGGQGTIAAASDARIDTVIIFNGGVTAVKPFLAISGDRDVSADLNTTNLQKGIDKVAKAAWLFFHKIPERGKSDGHLTLMTQPERVTGPTVAWLSYLLSNDPASKEWLVGPTCKLCTQPEELEYGQKGL